MGPSPQLGKIVTFKSFYDPSLKAGLNFRSIEVDFNLGICSSAVAYRLEPDSTGSTKPQIKLRVINLILISLFPSGSVLPSKGVFTSAEA